MLPEAVRAVLDNEPPPMEVIVVDQSDDPARTRRALDGLDAGGERLRVIADEGRGVARARNLGAAEAGGEIIAFTDDDAWVSRGWVGSILSAFRDPEFRIGVLGGRIVPVFDGASPGSWRMPPQWEHLLPAYDAGDEVRKFPASQLPAGVNFAMRRRCFEEMGGFDERLGPGSEACLAESGEDSELALRVQEQGYDLVYAPGVEVRHPVPPERQDPEFLEQRLYVEGATSLVLEELRGEGLSMRRRLALLSRGLRNLVSLRRRRSELGEQEYLLRRARTLGRLKMLWRRSLGRGSKD